MASADFGERPMARCDPIERRRRPTCTGRGSRLWARAWMCRPDARPSIDTSAASGRLATSPTVVIPRSWSFRAVTAPTPHSRSTGSGWRNVSSASGGTTSRPSGLATALATLARNLVRATPTVIGSPTRSRTSRRSATAISVGVPETLRRPPTSRNASSIDSPSTSGVVSSNTCEHRFARFGVRRHARVDHDRSRAQPARLRASHRRAHAIRLRLVAGREDDPRPDDHGLATKPWIVALLHRRVERVEVGVQDRGFTCHVHRRSRTYVRTR